MPQTEARKILKDAPIMWRRINSIGIILDCNSAPAAPTAQPPWVQVPSPGVQISENASPNGSPAESHFVEPNFNLGPTSANSGSTSPPRHGSQDYEIPYMPYDDRSLHKRRSHKEQPHPQGSSQVVHVDGEHYSLIRDVHGRVKGVVKAP